jgi:hypothetical protein
MRLIKSDEIVSQLLLSFNDELAKHLNGDVIVIKSPIRFGLDNVVRNEVEALCDGKGKCNKLVVVLETTGGYIEVVERIYKVFRKHYSHVDFIVPDFAYSAGTVLVMSGDAIYMDYYSVLGPIDPQYESEDGKFVPGIGYLEKYKSLVKAVNEATEQSSVRAEIAYLLKKFDPAILFFIEQARDHSVSLLEDWLPRHKFKNWKIKETTGKRVTSKDRKLRATEIAEILVNPERWHSHGRGIGINDLTSEEIRLKIENFGEDDELNKKIRNYYELFLDYCGKLGLGNMNTTVIHSPRGLRRF